MEAVASAVDLNRSVNLTIAPQPTPRLSEEDLRLARACADGDSEVFAAIYRKHGERMKSIAYNQLGNSRDAEDAVQETFLKVHRAAASYNGEAAVHARGCTASSSTPATTCCGNAARRIRETPIDELVADVRPAKRR